MQISQRSKSENKQKVDWSANKLSEGSVKNQETRIMSQKKQQQDKQSMNR